MNDKQIEDIRYWNEVRMGATCTGTLQKSHPRSFFFTVAKESEQEKMLMCEKPQLLKMIDGMRLPYMDVVVLQVLDRGQGGLLCELIEVMDLGGGKPC